MKIWRKTLSLNSELLIEITKSSVIKEEITIPSKRVVSTENYEIAKFLKDTNVHRALKTYFTEDELKNLSRDVMRVMDSGKEPRDEIKEIYTQWDLFLAAEKGNIELISTILKSGININSVDEYGNCVFFYTIGIVNSTSGFVYSDEMHKIVLYLLKMGAKPGIKNKDGETVLDKAWSHVSSAKETAAAKRFETDIKHHIENS